MVDDINSMERIEDGNDDIWVFVSHSSKDFEKVRKLIEWARYEEMYITH